MRILLKAMGGIIWNVVEEGYVILNEANPTQVDNENLLDNAQAMNVLICALCIREYHRVCKLKIAREMWEKHIEAHEGTSNVRVLSCLLQRANLKRLLYCQMKN
jgi:hypothetical protein